MKASTKGQMEIMGLVILVILITLAMFFYLSFKAQSPPVQVREDFNYEQLASNTIITFLKSQPCSDKKTMEQLIQNWALAESSGVQVTLKCDGVNVDDTVKNSLEKLYQATFSKWGLQGQIILKVERSGEPTFHTYPKWKYDPTTNKYYEIDNNGNEVEGSLPADTTFFTISNTKDSTIQPISLYPFPKTAIMQIDIYR